VGRGPKKKEKYGPEVRLAKPMGVGAGKEKVGKQGGGRIGFPKTTKMGNVKNCSQINVQDWNGRNQEGNRPRPGGGGRRNCHRRSGGGEK